MRIHLSFRSVMVRSLAVAFALLALSAASMAQLRVSVSFGPPAIPVYDQPLCPGDGYIWTPGYWDWDGDDADYFWVPGTWVTAPEVGFLWTPGWWGWGGDAFIFHDGFWGPTVGFYGGINYGFGYFGTGFVGGRWDGGHFFYNTAVWHVNNTIIHNVYNERVTVNNNNHVSYNGGNGGVEAHATPQQEEAERGRHIPPVAAQTRHVQEARGNRELRASVNQGRPSIAATEKPGDFSSHVEAAREAGAPYHPPANRGTATGRREESRPENARPEGNAANAVHPKDLPPAERSPAPNTGNAKLDQKYQKQQQKLAAQQDKERQKLQAQQDKEHQQYAKQQASPQRTQQLEQKHQQQTQQLQQRHSSQVQQMQQRQAPRAPRGR